jgi:hypothetical protein
LALTAAGAALALLPILAAPSDARAERKIILRAADPTRQVDVAAVRAIAAARRQRGPVAGKNMAAKRAANRAAALERAKGLPAFAPTAESGGGFGRNVAQVGGHNDPGQDADAANQWTPADATGAINGTRYIQLVNARFAIYNRTTDALISTGTLNTLFDQPSGADSFEPQIIWDNQTQRFYYAGVTIRSATANVLSFGWSTGPSPGNGTTHWCSYEIQYADGSILPGFPRLGDSQFFIIIGTNDFNAAFNYIGSTLWAVSKPSAGAACANAANLRFGARIDIREAGAPAERVYSPVPANDIETKTLGYWVGTDDDATSTRLYIGSVSRNASTGNPIFNNPKNLTVASYTVPADATQVGSTRLIYTSDGRNTQAVMAKNPDRANAYSLFTQHTIRGASANSSFVRWYEINPFATPPTVLRTGNVGQNTPNVFFYNGAISPDRRAQGATRQFGDSFVLYYNVSRTGGGGFNPRLNSASSFNGGAIGAAIIVRSSPGPYFDYTCPGATDTCNWGGAAATPDPAPPGTTRGAVWGTNQTAGPGANVDDATWDTFFYAHTP